MARACNIKASVLQERTARGAQPHLTGCCSLGCGVLVIAKDGWKTGKAHQDGAVSCDSYDVDSGLNELAKALVRRYTAAGESVITIVNFTQTSNTTRN